METGLKQFDKFIKEEDAIGIAGLIILDDEEE